jgi:LacI family transcriptional regulator
MSSCLQSAIRVRQPVLCETARKTKRVAVLGMEDCASDHIGPPQAIVASLAMNLKYAGYQTWLGFLSPQSWAQKLPSLGVDGVAVFPSSRAEDLQPLEDSGIPYVSIGGPAGRRGSQVVADDAGGMRLVLRYLMGLGHRTIAHFDNPDRSGHFSDSVRRTAFALAAGDLGFQTPPLRHSPLPPGAGWDSYCEPFLKQAVQEGKATAVLAYSHHGALAILRAARGMGLSVPGDFSLVCFNNEPLTGLSVPSITVVDIPAGLLGQTVAELLLRQINSPQPGDRQCVTLNESLIVRESTAAPARKRKAAVRA